MVPTAHETSAASRSASSIERRVDHHINVLGPQDRSISRETETRAYIYNIYILDILYIIYIYNIYILFLLTYIIYLYIIYVDVRK